MTTRPRRRAETLRIAFLSSIALVSLCLVLTSLHLGYDLSRPVPFYDQWEFVRRADDVLAGHFGLFDLAAQHNEHRIATARAVFLVDLWLADGTGYLSIAVLYCALAAIAAVLARSFAGDRLLVATTFLLCFGILVSPAQWENLSSGFQVQFPFVDLFGMLSLSCLIAAMTRGGCRGRAWCLLAAASTFDLLAVFSMASGTLLLVPALWIGLVLRRSARVFAAFVASHIAACGLFALHYVRVVGVPPVFEPSLLIRYAVVYMGSALRGYPHGPLGLGLLDLAVLAGAGAALLLRSRRGDVDRVALFAASVALLLLANGFLTAVGRASFGVAGAVASRYAIQSLLLQPTLLVLLWRESRHWPRASIRAPLGPGLLLAGTALSLMTNLSAPSSLEWRGRVDLLDRAGYAFAQGLFDDETLRLVYPEPRSVRQVVRRYAAQRLGPFSARFGDLYRPPLNLLVGLDLDAVEPCRADFGFERVGPSVVGVEGWAFDEKDPTGDGFIALVARAERDRIVGFGGQSVMRDDVDRALNVSVGRSGFDVPVRLATSSGDARGLTLLVIPRRAGHPACGATVALPPTASAAPGGSPSSAVLAEP